MANHEFKWKHFAPEIILWCLRWYGSTPMAVGLMMASLKLINVDGAWSRHRRKFMDARKSCAR